MFVFKLQSVLNAKKAKEEKVLMEYHSYLQEIQKAQYTLNEMKEEKKGMIDKLRKLQSCPITTDEIAISYKFIRQLSREIREKERQIEEMKALAEKKRKDLLSVMKERKMLEKLKEKHFKEFKQHHETKEKNFFDESAILRFTKNEHE
ncbi:MAG: flagellar export protein FliJ [Syntrophales bacterium]|nr:flagellar export protein FliJ [Syntrophales bacterium]